MHFARTLGVACTHLGQRARPLQYQYWHRRLAGSLQKSFAPNAPIAVVRSDEHTSRYCHPQALVRSVAPAVLDKLALARCAARAAARPHRQPDAEIVCDWEV